jgi:hypothetical protein
LTLSLVVCKAEFKSVNLGGIRREHTTGEALGELISNQETVVVFCLWSYLKHDSNPVLASEFGGAVEVTSEISDKISLRNAPIGPPGERMENRLG